MGTKGAAIKADTSGLQTEMSTQLKAAGASNGVANSLAVGSFQAAKQAGATTGGSTTGGATSGATTGGTTAGGATTGGTTGGISTASQVNPKCERTQTEVMNSPECNPSIIKRWQDGMLTSLA